jgi:excisionase family DNA binding protein
MLSVKQAAGRLGVSPSLVYWLVSARKLRHSRIGSGRGRIRISEDAIGEYLARCTFDVKEEPTPPVRPPKLKHLRLD